MRTSQSSLMHRAMVAVLLTIGFYALALGIVALLLFVFYAQFRFPERVSSDLGVPCGLLAVFMLWSILPRIQRFTPPGPRVELEKNPDLFREVNAIAERVEQKLPDEVYLTLQMNASVAEHRGLLGAGSRRIMVIGLPLLQVLTIPQFRAVIAHEFGHFYGGDTKLAPWVYRTRETIVRTIRNLGPRSWTALLFRWYGRMFLRVTQGISRRQEYVADEVAARVVGSLPLVEGLCAIHAGAPAFDAFWQSEVAPVIQDGYRPPLAEGFGLFLSGPSVAEAMQRSVEHDLEVPTADPYDSHPSLSERIAAAQALPPGADAVDHGSALSLLQNVPDLEQGLLAQLLGKGRAASLQPLDWPSAAAKVWLPGWDKTLREYGAGMQGVTAASLPALLRSPGALGLSLEQAAGRFLSGDEKSRRVADIAAMALAAALAHQGWTLAASPGAPVSLQRGEIRIEPFTVVRKLASGELSAEAWQARCEEAGIADLRLDGAVCA